MPENSAFINILSCSADTNYSKADARCKPHFPYTSPREFEETMMPKEMLPFAASTAPGHKPLHIRNYLQSSSMASSGLP